jgi:hypothetical protein
MHEGCGQAVVVVVVLEDSVELLECVGEEVEYVLELWKDADEVIEVMVKLLDLVEEVDVVVLLLVAVIP